MAPPSHDFAASFKITLPPRMVSNFRFPIDNPDTLEDLEYAVKNDSRSKAKYIKFLRRIKPTTTPLSRRDVFRKIFSDTAIFPHFCFSVPKIDNDGNHRRALKCFQIFEPCMLEAWSEHSDISKHTLAETLKRLIKRINCRNYVRLGRIDKSKKKH